jgi:RNA polymerase sigma factor (sigma-70 family)
VRSPPHDAHGRDRALAQRVLDGSTEAWHEFVQQYFGLIRHVVARYLPLGEDARTLEVEILEQVYRSKLRSYEGRSSLSTWIALVTRNAVLDSQRSRFGRRTVPRGVERLGTRDREVFRLYYVEGLGFDAVLHRLPSLSRDGLFEALGRIESEVSGRAMRRVLRDVAQRSAGTSRGRLLEYRQHVEREAETVDADSPDARLLRRETEAAGRAVLEYLRRLPDEERKVLSLRFVHGRTAKEIAAEMGISTRRRVYTILDRVQRRVRRAFGGREPTARDR